MPSPVAAIGGTAIAYVPDDAQQLTLGYTHVRFYWASSEGGAYSLATSVALVSGQRDYSYNLTTALATDWFTWALYGAVPGEGPQSEPAPLGPARSTRLAIRQGVGARLKAVLVYPLASVGSATAGVVSELIDPDASPHVIGNRFARIVSGTGIGQTRRVRSGSTGYTVASGTITINRATSPAWVANDSVELWLPDGDQDPSVAIDDAMQRARSKLWWEDTFYLSTDDSISDYYVAAAIRDERIKRVEYAADTYPTRPNWVPVGYFDCVMDGGNPLLTVKQSGLGNSLYSGGTVIRIVYNRFGDRMDSDTDYWEVPLEWAIAEVAYEYLKNRVAPGGGREDVSDARAAIAAVLDDVMGFRLEYLPSVATRMRTAT